MGSEQAEVESEAIDRSPPDHCVSLRRVIFPVRAVSEKWIGAKELRLRFEMPAYYSHALELTLKAFLRCKGVPSNHLRSHKFGHKLQVLWDACVAEGLCSHPVTDAFIKQAVELLDPFATDFEFRFLKIGIQATADAG